MDIATLFAWFVIAVLFIAVVSAIVALGSLPGHIAKQRSHPHAEAINAASWIGLALGGVLWPIAFVWSLIPFVYSVSARDREVETLRSQVAELQAKLDTLERAST